MRLKKALYAAICAMLCVSMVMATPVQAATGWTTASEKETNGDEDDGEIVEYGEDGQPVTSSKASSTAATPAKSDTTSQKNQISNLSDKYDDLKAEKERLDKLAADAKKNKDKFLGEKAYIDDQINNTLSQIEVLENRIEALEEAIAEKNEEITQKQAEIDSQYDLFKKRLRATYMTGDSTKLGMVLGADSFGQFLTQASMVTRVAQKDKELMENLVAERTELEQMKADVEENKRAQEADKEDLGSKKLELANQQSTVQKQIQDISAMEQEFLADKEKLQKEMKAVQAEIDKIYASMKSMGEFVGGEFAWPVPGYSQISSGFGWRFGNSDNHTGIDITGSGVHGKNIVAANSGKVAFVATSYVNGYGYGKYLIVDHGGGYSTLYAHTSSILVSVGDTVPRGQTIAKVGSTGWSTGPHLHFEIRINGKAQNPIGYLKGK